MSSITVIGTEEGGGVNVVSLNDEKIIDDLKIQQLAKELNEQLDKSGEKRRVLINFARVKFMSSAMIGKLILLGKRCKNEQIELKLCSITPNIMEVFKIMKLNKVFDIQDDEPKAMKAFERKGWFG
jgi:anti-sigma B factor antagonist